MAGPGIRAWHFAAELSKHFPTSLICRSEGPAQTGVSVPHQLRTLDWREGREALREAAVLIGQPARRFHRYRPGQRIVFDLFDPILLELEEMYGQHPSLRQRVHRAAERWRLNRALAEGDLLICATAKQRELYDGARDRIIEVPFGVELSVAPAILPAREPENLVLWGGGTWEWLDPRTAVDAIVKLNRQGLTCRLLFLGRERPNLELVDRRRQDRFDQLVASGAPFVMANEQWVPYGQRLAWLRRSRIAIMLHRPTAEAPYSIRTRLFDAIATATPVIATEEGFAAELVAREGLGIIVPPADVDAVAQAIRRLLQDDVFRAQCVSNLERIRPLFAWDVVTRPLVEAVQRWAS
jgi:glycosyltransferase involved in cell wall biosynthesis